MPGRSVPASAGGSPGRTWAATTAGLARFLAVTQLQTTTPHPSFQGGGMRHGSFPMLGRAVLAGALLVGAAPASAQYQMERLSRGVIAVRTSATQVYVGWRLFGNDPAGIGFNVYRSATAGRRSASTAPRSPPPPTSSTPAPTSASRTRISSGRWWAEPSRRRAPRFTLPANAPDRQYLEIPLQLPAGGTVNGSSYTYSPGDVSVGDLDGDGEYESSLKWDPSNQQGQLAGRLHRAASSSTPTSSTGRACGASTSGATSAPARTTPSSRSTTTTATAAPRWR